MTVWIKEEEFDYISDYPDGWKRAKGDFKFPVSIGRHKCFIKRFNKSPESISGWGLLTSLIVKIEDGANYTMSKHEKNLPKVHDIVKTTEKNEKIHYVFLELIDGDTLSKMLTEHVKIDLEKLTEDLFSAFQSLNKYGFWFPDFFEKNICCDRRGNFYLVDLDSAQPVTKPPDIDMWGEKEYWALVFDFYKKILGKQNFKPSNVNGVLLNYLQTIFLILRIKIHNSQNEKEYSEINITTSHLNKISTSFKDIFIKALSTDSTANFQNIILEIKHLIKEHIIQSNVFEPSSGSSTYSSEPVIKKFIVTNHSKKADGGYIIESGKAFEMNWEVENASDIQLYKNGQFFKKIQQDEESIEIVEEVYDRDEKKVEFELIASHSGEVVSELLTVSIIQNEPKIIRFEINNYVEKNGNEYEVENEKTYTLTWDVENAEKVKLYKNGSLLNEFATDQNDISVTEKIYDGSSRPIEYSLVALQGSNSETKTLAVNVKKTVAIPPVINDFKATGNTKKSGDNYIVENKKPFFLSWDIENATEVKLFRNGTFINEFDNKENQVELTETFDVSGKIVKYTITAANNFAETASKSITITSAGMVVNFYLINYTKKRGDNEYVVTKDKPFRLKWDVENVQNLGLLRNGKSYEILDPKKDFVEVRETIADQKRTAVEYTLVASSGSEIQRRSVSVIVKTPSPINWIYIMAALILLGIIGTIAYNRINNNNNGSVKNDTSKNIIPHVAEYTTITPLVIGKMSEGDTLRIAGTNLPENDNAIEVIFNAIPGKILHHTDNDVKVLVPHVADNNVSVIAKVNDTTFKVVENVPYKGKAVTPTHVLVNTLPISQVLENSYVTVTGENFPTKEGLISVKFNNATAPITRQSAKRVMVKVPVLQEGELVDISMKVNGETFQLARGLRYRKPAGPKPPGAAPTLNAFSQNTITEDEIITIRGNNIPTEPGTVQVIFDGKVRFTIVDQSSTSIRAKVPTLALRSGIIAVKINDKYIPLPNSLVNYRLR